MALDTTLDAGEVGILVIDMQNGFCHLEGSRGRAFGADSVRRASDAIAPVGELVRLGRQIGSPVWFTRQVHYPGDVSRSRRRLPSHLERRGVRLDLCHRGTWDAELVDEVAALVEDPEEVLVKHRASAFYQTALEAELRMTGVQVLVVAGVTTSFCVDSTIRDAYARDFDVLVPGECVADSDPAAHDAVLRSVDRFHGRVTSMEELRGALGKVVMT